MFFCSLPDLELGTGNFGNLPRDTESNAFALRSTRGKLTHILQLSMRQPMSVNIIGCVALSRDL